MNITEITTKAGAHRRRKRVGRGEGSGLGKTSGRGHKGEGARSGGLKGGMYEGGVFPFFRRIPKVGFSNKIFRTEYQIVNVGDLDTHFPEGGHVTAAALHEAGLIRDPAGPVKVLGDGELKKKLSVEAQRFSGSAAGKIETCGGSVKRLGPQPRKKFIKRPPAPKAEAPADKAEQPEKAEKTAGAKGKPEKAGKKPRPAPEARESPPADEKAGA